MIKKLIKEIPFALLIHRSLKNFNNMFNLLLIKILNFFKLKIHGVLLYSKINQEPKIIEYIISKSLYKNNKKLLKLIKKAIYYQSKKLSNLENNFQKIDEYFFLGRLFFYYGNNKNFLKYISKSESLKIKLKNKSKFKNLDEVFLPRNTIHVLGLIGHLDGILKYFILNNIKTKLNLIGDNKTNVNSYFFSLYEKYINFINIETVNETVLEKEKYLLKEVHWVLPNKQNKLQICHKTIANSVSEWRKKNLKPLIEIPKNDRKDFLKFKKAMNIPNNSKLICLHIRTDKYHMNHNKNADRYRNSELHTYLPAINYINSLGYYVVRLGERLEDNDYFQKLKHKEMFIDYPSSQFKSGKMDLILSNEAIFFIATDSGPHWYAGSLSKNLCLINSPFKDGFPYYSKTIFLPLRYKMNGNEIHYSQILKSYTNCHFDWQFDKNSIKIEKNNSFDIQKTIEEAFFENNLIDSYNYKNLKQLKSDRKKFSKLSNFYNRSIFSKPSEVYFNRTRLNRTI